MQYAANYSPFSADNASASYLTVSAAWQALLPQSLEAYHYHLAFAQAGIEGFKTGYVTILAAEKVVLIAPVFVMDYALDTTVQGKLKAYTSKLRDLFPKQMTLRLLCVGSAVTDCAQVGFDKNINDEIIQILNQKLEEIAAMENASVIAFKDITEAVLRQLKIL